MRALSVRDGEVSLGVEEVWGGEDLSVIVICSTCTAKATSATEDGGVRQQNSRRVVSARNSLLLHLDEAGRNGVPELGLNLGGIVREWLTEDLAASNEHLAIGQDNSIGENTWEPHRVDGLDVDWNSLCVDGEDVRIGSSIGTLVAGCATNSQDLASSGVVHDCIPAHSVTVNATSSCRGGTATSRGIVPVHSSAWTSLKHSASFPAEEPAMIVRAIDTLLISRKHGSDRSAIEKCPCICRWVVDFAIFGNSVSTRPRAANGECIAV